MILNHTCVSKATSLKHVVIALETQFTFKEHSNRAVNKTNKMVGLIQEEQH